MKVYLLSAYPKCISDGWLGGNLRAFQSSAKQSSGRHSVVDDPRSADIILFVDRGPLPFGLSLLLMPIWWIYNSKCFLYDEQDYPCRWHRGLIVSLESFSYKYYLHRGAAYIREGVGSWTKQLPFNGDQKHLFSFCGSLQTHPVRQAIMDKLSDYGYILDVPRAFTQTAFMRGDVDAIRSLRSQLESICEQSMFVLCPRGVGASSIRVFEVMSMGRAPIIISDAWVPPYGPDWSSFSIRVPENQIQDIPELLHKLYPKAQYMGQQARTAWEQWFAPSRHYDTTVLACIDIIDGGRKRVISVKTLLKTLFSINCIREVLRYYRAQIVTALLWVQKQT